MRPKEQTKMELLTLKFHITTANECLSSENLQSGAHGQTPEQASFHQPREVYGFNLYKKNNWNDQSTFFLCLLSQSFSVYKANLLNPTHPWNGQKKKKKPIKIFKFTVLFVIFSIKLLKAFIIFLKIPL
jgi:hypothetical protein